MSEAQRYSKQDTEDKAAVERLKRMADDPSSYALAPLADRYSELFEQLGLAKPKV